MRATPEEAGFTLVELLVTLSILAVLLVISMPVSTAARGSLNLIRCLDNGKRIGAAWVQWCESQPNDDAQLKALQPLDHATWVAHLGEFGLKPTSWLCPVAQRERRSTGATAISDFHYTGMRAWAYRYAPNRGEHYAFVETIPNHNGCNIYVRGDGSAGYKNFTDF